MVYRSVFFVYLGLLSFFTYDGPRYFMRCHDFSLSMEFYIFDLCMYIRFLLLSICGSILPSMGTGVFRRIGFLVNFEFARSLYRYMIVFSICFRILFRLGIGKIDGNRSVITLEFWISLCVNGK